MKTIKFLSISAIILASFISCDKETQADPIENEIQETSSSFDLVEFINTEATKNTDAKNAYPVPETNFNGDWNIKSISDVNNTKFLPASSVGLDFFPNSYYTNAETLEIDVNSSSVELTSILSTGDEVSLGTLDFAKISENNISITSESFAFNYRAWTLYNSRVLVAVRLNNEGEIVGRYHWFEKQ